MVAESLEGQLAELAGEAGEKTLKNIFGLAIVEHLEGILKDGKRAALLKLDNVLVVDHVRSIAARGENGGRLRALASRASKGQGQQREQDRQTHCH